MLLFVRQSICPSVAYIANNPRTQRSSMSTFGAKVPGLRCDSHTSFKVKRSKVRVTDEREQTVSAEPDATLLVIYPHPMLQRTRCVFALSVPAFKHNRQVAILV